MTQAHMEFPTGGVLAAALHFRRRVVGGTALRAVSVAGGLAVDGFGAHFAIRAIREVL